MRNNNFDLLRLLAAIEVLLKHSTYHLYVEKGYDVPSLINSIQKVVEHIPGVPVFFLLSGYLISMSYIKNPDIKSYTANRVLRIFPGLYLNIFISVLILSVFGFVQLNFNFFGWLLAQASIVQFYNAEMFRGFGVGVINGSLWTISVELTFYIILPFLIILYSRNKYILLALFVISYLFWSYDVSSSKEIFLNKLLHNTILPYLFLFIVGMLFYNYRDACMKYIENKFLLWLMLYVGFESGVYALHIDMNPFLYVIHWGIFSFLIFSFAFSFKGVSTKLLKGNDYTYGIYIYHMLVINVFVHLNMVGNIKYLYLVFLLSIILGMASWHFIEKPFLRLKKHSLFNDAHIK